MSDRRSAEEERLRGVFRALGQQQVEYAVFGAVALGLHGLARATADLDLFIRPNPENVERLKAALRMMFEDPSIDDITAEDLCGDYPAVRYYPPDGFGFDILTRLGDAFQYDDLEIEKKDYDSVLVRVVSPRTLWLMKKDTTRPTDRFDADVLAERFGFREE
ncbi:MAG: nucleotidyl transferase AbiEii/AbiGii toxin family protein [Acidobacteriota bacterium]